MIRGERRAMIRSDIPGLSLSRQCQILSISRSSIYYRPRGESRENLALMRRIDELFLKYPFYGSRQMVHHLAREGLRVGRHRIRRDNVKNVNIGSKTGHDVGVKTRQSRMI